MPVTLDKVARRAGVSPATVSRVLNHTGRVSESTRARVLRAVKDLKYHPNLAARTLAHGRSRTLGLVVSNLGNPFFLPVLGFSLPVLVAAVLAFGIAWCAAGLFPVCPATHDQGVRWLFDLATALLLLELLHQQLQLARARSARIQEISRNDQEIDMLQ